MDNEERGVDFSLADLVRTGARKRPHAPCVSFDGRTLDYVELDARSNRVAQALRAAGVGPGERVAIIARNSPVFYELVFGCAKSGAILVPINWRLSPREVADILGDARPRLLLVGAEQQVLLSDTAGCEVLVLEEHYEAWRDTAAGVDPALEKNPDAPVALLYTSGTTGRPKGVIITHRNLFFSTRMAREVWAFTNASVNLVAMPLFHVGGLGYGLMALSQGGHTVLLRQPIADPILEAIQDFGVTHAFFVPTVIQSLVDAKTVEGMRLGSLERLIYGASPISETLLKRAIEIFGCGFNHAYGMTETAGTVVTLMPQDHDPGGPKSGRLRSCGRAVPWVELGLFDPATGEPVPTGEIGEIWVRSAMNTPGYWNQPGETAALLRADGWLRTGDAASQDEEGFVYIQDRYKDMIVSGGENVFPAEVENVLSGHPRVAEVAVIGLPHPRWGETVTAVVVAAPGPALEPCDLIVFARARLAHYKSPTRVEVLEELPKSASGKILKRELRRLLIPTGPAP